MSVSVSQDIITAISLLHGQKIVEVSAVATRRVSDHSAGNYEALRLRTDSGKIIEIVLPHSVKDRVTAVVGD